jgi:hypothetical protein
MTLSRMRSTLAAVAVLLFGCAGGAGAQGAQPDLKAIERIEIDSAITQPEIPLINIDISKIVFESVKRVIEEDKTFALGAGADARLKLAINSYGFGVAGLFGGDARRPLIHITALLVSSAGDVVWKKTDYITNLSKLTEAYTYDQLAQNPRLTVKSLEQVSVLLSRQRCAAALRAFCNAAQREP